MGKVEKTLINSALVSAQNRQRYYWTNFEVTQPEDKGVLLKDIIEHPMDEKYNLSDEAIARFKPCKKTNSGQIGTTAHEGKIGQRDRVYDADGKMVTLTATIYKQPPQYVVIGIKKVTNVNPSGRGMNGNVYHVDAKSPTLTTNKGEGVKITGGAIRGRYLVDGKRQDHKMKTAGLTEQRLEVRNDEKTNTLTTVQKDNVVVFRPASIVGRRLNERGVRDDYNKDVAITQCLQVKHKNDKTGCLTTVDKDNVLSVEPPGRYPDIYNRCDISYRKLTPIECERLQTFPCGWTSAIEKHIYSLYNCKETDKKEDLHLCDVKSMVAKGKQEQKSKVTCALCTTNDLLGMGLLSYQRLISIKMQSVNIAIEKLEKKEVELEGCVVDITKTGLDMKTLYMQIKSSLNLGQQVTKNALVVKTSTGKLLRIISAESCQEMRLFTILIAIKLITQLRICMYVKDRANINYCIDSLKELQGNLLGVVLLSLRMETTEQTVSNTQRYRSLGNAWTVDVIAHIFKCMQRVEG